MVSIEKAIENIRKLPVQRKSKETKNLYKKIEKAFLNAIQKDLEKINGNEIFLALSGGIDSSLLLALIATHFQNYKLIGITVGSKKCLDIPFSKKISKLYNISHIVEPITEKEIKYLKKEQKLIYKKLRPKNLLGMEGFPIFVLYKMLSKYTKTFLVGDGLDELAGGYIIHRDPANLYSKSYQKIFFQPTNEKERSLIKKATTIRQDYPSKENILASLEYFWKIFEIDLFFSKEYSKYLKVEPKMPYLDETVIKTLSEIPLTKKIDKKEGKKIIKKLALKYLPPELIFRKKIGLPNILCF